MKEILRKLSSRKLWLALAGVAAGIAMALGADATEIQSIAGAITAIAGVITYIVTEGKIDAERVKTAIEETQKAVETIERTEG
jgi:phage shock protein PspC (stress-responsive transcriptional regulator)